MSGRTRLTPGNSNTRVQHVVLVNGRFRPIVCLDPVEVAVLEDDLPEVGQESGYWLGVGPCLLLGAPA